MTYEEFYTIVTEARARQLDLLQKKGVDYSDGADRLSNFKQAGRRLGPPLHCSRGGGKESGFSSGNDFADRWAADLERSGQDR